MESSAIESAPQVLLICANTDLVDRVSHDLEEAGYGVSAVATGAKGVEQAKRSQPALIIVDRLLGSESGLTVCQKLRSAKLCTPVLLLMAREALEDRVACLEAGADDYCLKPYQADAFFKDCANLFAARRNLLRATAICRSDPRPRHPHRLPQRAHHRADHEGI